ncbi:MAG: cytochrome C oxidase subunit IV family protein [Microthrixaceae bacterium]|nr:cytochrome C oxidase subunit IV family protein [Microthrixaceae bacterium]MCO5318188.1 cytochrome C oxidase subunit IV family protein [Microthrixaceae bacterium]
MSSENETGQGHFGKEDPSSPEAEEHSGGVAAPPAPDDRTVPSDGGDDDGRHMGHLDEGHTHGPTDSQYFTIFWVLFGLTALEVSTYFWESWFGEGDVVRRVGVAVLLTIMLIKFALIAGFFMHLRFDAALVKRVFVFGLGVAFVIYLVAMTSMNIWTDNGNPWFNDPPPEVTTTTLPDGG